MNPEAVDIAIQKYEQIYNECTKEFDALGKLFNLLPVDGSSDASWEAAHRVIREISDCIASRRNEFYAALGRVG